MTGVKSRNTLRGEERDHVAMYMNEIVQIFLSGDARRLDDLTHPGQSEKQIDVDRRFVQGLMDIGDRVVSWSARRYTEPSWSIMKYNQFEPEPTVWVDVTLNNGSRDYPFFFALAPNANGDLRCCYYVDRVRPRKKKAVAKNKSTSQKLASKKSAQLRPAKKKAAKKTSRKRGASN